MPHPTDNGGPFVGMTPDDIRAEVAWEDEQAFQTPDCPILSDVEVAEAEAYLASHGA